MALDVVAAAVAVGAEWSDGIVVLADHIVTPVMLSTSDFDVGAQTSDLFEKLKSRVDDPSSLPRHHLVLNMVDPKTTRADAALMEEALTRFPMAETVMMRRNTYKEMDQKGLDWYRSERSPQQGGRVSRALAEHRLCRWGVPRRPPLPVRRVP
ncbi:hypothetical protein QO034_12390 [Sedimentitalea sp. JM2-8]|uniref:Uncharacterized protein n=1 Tax=Sedimentitalea xiamensis TaxID=3050037 RepID=A0ABT7FFM3_9RHOB|nr:hypothetical protein [Sedimentitalea xiamensis]MDK3073912.1 hypothetical protein [Sedimentitalea xiamensis]